MIRDTKHVATCLGFGPRFLHSTGQAYKGGPNSRRVRADHLRRSGTIWTVPGQKYTFGVVKAAQALGDFDVLDERGAARCGFICTDVEAGLAELARAIDQALFVSDREQQAMQLGMIGLGRMGGNIVRRLMQRRPSTASSTT